MMELEQFLRIMGATDAPTVAVLLLITYWMKSELTAQRDFYEKLISGLLEINGKDSGED